MFSTPPLIMHSATMAKKSLVPSVHMKWIAVTDRKGNRRLQMHWRSN
jgi:hypothetical protein